MRQQKHSGSSRKLFSPSFTSEDVTLAGCNGLKPIPASTQLCASRFQCHVPDLMSSTAQCEESSGPLHSDCTSWALLDQHTLTGMLFNLQATRGETGGRCAGDEAATGSVSFIRVITEQSKVFVEKGGQVDGWKTSCSGLLLGKCIMVHFSVYMRVKYNTGWQSGLWHCQNPRGSLEATVRSVSATLNSLCYWK